MLGTVDLRDSIHLEGSGRYGSIWYVFEDVSMLIALALFYIYHRQALRVLALTSRLRA